MESNNAKLREALEYAVNNDDIRSRYDLYECTPLGKVYRKLKEALAAPARNCDVGTAEEQYVRFIAFCSSNGIDKNGYHNCAKCKLIRARNCEFAWLQMPYEEGVADGAAT